ncbi:hypothetical protein BG58_04775 [Caballeronia jiangsuensis]|nr:hypothetical protein BG58_04775 [Caballeronia jiangsuensis]
MVTERHFKLSSQQMVGSQYAPIFFGTIEDCQANLRNYIAYKAQADSSGTGQTFIHAIATDQFADNLPEIGPELVTLQCWDMAGSNPTQAPAPDFSSAEKVVGKQSDASELPPKGPERKPTVYLNANEPFTAKAFDEAHNEANQVEPYPVILGMVAYDLDTEKVVRGGKTPYTFDDFTTCWSGAGNYVAYMVPQMKRMPHRLIRVSDYHKQFKTAQYIGRDPESQKVLLYIPGCAMKQADGKFSEDPKHGPLQPEFEIARGMVARGFVK